MTPMMYERVRNLFVNSGLTAGFTVQQLMYDDTGKLTEAIMVFRPNGGTNIRNELGSEYHVIVDVIGAKDKRRDAMSAVQRIVDYVQANPISDSCVGHIENMGGIPPPVLTEEGRIVFRLQFACLYGE
ncbi:phage tail termination protein [Huaxiibacter chinensis]|uniref:phage tail termination protein n=1 Tax=Huaxiibacter chinensis TaxID=2899785 RepID=UPI003D314D0E